MTEKRRKPSKKPTPAHAAKRESILSRLLGFEPLADIAASERATPADISDRMKVELAAVVLAPAEFEHLRAIETLRLDRYRRALDGLAMTGDAQAVRVCIDASKAVLAWAQAGQAVKVEHSGTLKHLNVDATKLSDAELRDLAAGTWPEASEGVVGGGGAGAAPETEGGRAP